MTVEIPVKTLKLWIEDLVYAYEGLTYEFFYYEPHKYADRVQGVLTKMLAAMPADEEE